MRRSAARRHQRRMVAAVAGVLVLVVVAVGLLVASGRIVLPWVSGKVYQIHYKSDIEAAAAKYDVDPYLVAAVAATESGYKPGATSHAGAVGLMQLMPSTADWIVRVAEWKGSKRPELTDAKDSLNLGACYLAYLIKRYSGNIRDALAAYNAGHGNVDKWLAAAGTGTLTLADIPFLETRNFVKRVEQKHALYKRIYPTAFGSATEGS